jgi:hypothetical protein
MYVGLLAHKAKLGLGALAGAIATGLDADGDGKIGSTELKALLQVGLGFRGLRVEWRSRHCYS